MQKIKVQTGSTRTDARGNEVPANYLLKSDRLAERNAVRVANKAMAIQEQLKELKTLIQEATDDVFQQKLADKKVQLRKERKGGYSWHSFDGSIKVEASVSDIFSFDDALMGAAKESFDEFVNNSIEDKNHPIRLMIQEAFASNRRGYDPKKLFALLKYREKVKDSDFLKALDLLQDAMKVTSTKRYYRVYTRNNEGEYLPINLNFSSL